MKASKIEIGGENRIRIEAPYNQALASKLKTIPGTIWSTSIKSWHFPYTKESFTWLKQLFPDLEYPNK